MLTHSTPFKTTGLAATSLLGVLLLLGGCSNDEPSQTTSDSSTPTVAEDRWLSQIPASTPYFLASRERLSEADAMALIEKFGTMEDIEFQITELEVLRDETDDEAIANFLDIVVGLLRTFDQVNTLEDYHERGMMPNARSAIYGLGLLPAIRIELHNEERFRSFFESLITDLAIDLQTSQLGDTHYWHSSAESFLQSFITIKDEQLIIGLLPSTVEQAVIEELFGLTLPNLSLLQSGAIEQLEQRYQYSPYGSGRFSTQKIVHEVISPVHPATQALMAAGGAAPLDVEQCRSDIDRLTHLFPAIVMGLHAVDTQRISASVRLATSSDIADDLSSITTSVPGLGSGQGIASLGIALDIPAVTRALQKYAGQVRTIPFTCPELEGINEMWGELGLLTNNPMTMLVGPALSGINVRLDSFTMDPMQPTGSGVIGFATPNAQGLVSAISMFVPQIASLNLQSNGEVKQVDPSLLPPDTPSVHAAMSDKAILLGVGLDQPSQLKTELNQPAGRSDLMLYGHLRSDTFASLAEISSQLPNTDAMDTAELLYMAEIYEKVAFWLGVDGSGFELGVEVELK